MSDFIVPFESNFQVPSTAVDTSVIATRAYVDATFQNLDWKNSVRAISAAALPAYTRVGNVITANANGALAAVNGITLLANNRLALKDGAAGADNGLYSVTQVGTGSLPFILTRATDADSSAKFTARLAFEVEEGTNAGLWHCTNTGTITLNTTSITLAQFSGGASLGTDVADIQPVGTANVLGASASAAPINHAHKFAISGQTTGDIIYFDGTNWVRLAKDTNGKYLTLSSGFPAWATVPTTDLTADFSWSGASGKSFYVGLWNGNTAINAYSSTLSLGSGSVNVVFDQSANIDWTAISNQNKHVTFESRGTAAGAYSYFGHYSGGYVKFQDSGVGTSAQLLGAGSVSVSSNGGASLSLYGSFTLQGGQSSSISTYGTAKTLTIDTTGGTYLYKSSTLVADFGVTSPTALTMATGTKLTLDSGTATGSGLAVTLNKQVGVITTEALTTGAQTSDTYTVTNSLVSSSSRIFCQPMKGSNTVPYALLNVTPGTGSFTIQIYNLYPAGGGALNGTVVFSFKIL